MRPDYTKHQQRWIKINGIDTREWGVRVLKLPPLSLAQENIIEYEVPGRNELLIEHTGEYKPKTMTVGLFVDSADPLEAAYEIISARTVELSNDPGFIYDCVIPGQQDLPRQILNWHSFTVSFRCSALKRLPVEEKLTIGINGITLENIGTVPNRPKVEFTVDGSKKAIEIRVIHGSIVDSIWAMQVLGDIVVDSQERTIWQNGKNVTETMGGDFAFLEIEPGKSKKIALRTSSGEAYAGSIYPQYRWR